MKRVTGIGGVFFKAANTKETAQWYDKHLGLSFNGNTYMSFKWRNHEQPDEEGSTVFSVFPSDTKYFAPSSSPFMFNLRVENLDELLEVLKSEGVEITGGPELYPYGKFAWILDNNGNKVELWEPIESGFDE